MNERELLQQGLGHHQAGRLAEASACYQEVLRDNPVQPEALYFLGILSHQTGNQEEAIKLMRRAIAVVGDQPPLHEILGLALMSLGRYKDAELSLLRAVASGTAESLNNLGILRKKQARMEEAIAAFERAVQINPSFADALYNLGNAEWARNRAEKADEYWKRAVASNPAHADAWAALGQVSNSLCRHREAVEQLRRAVQLRPGDAQLQCDLAGAFEALREFAGAAECYRAALAIDPTRHETRHNLAHAMFELGRADEALDLFREAARGPRGALTRGMIAVMIPGAPTASNQEILDARREFAENDVLPWARPVSLPLRAQSSALRIGYLSSFFHRQNWMKPVWALLAKHDRDRFEIHLFSDAPQSAMPEGYAAGAGDRFHDISGLSNDAAARLIAGQSLDLLIDLNAYSKLKRLPLMARRPARVIVGWFNHFATTGMKCYDYLIGDEEVIPAGEEPFYSEKLARVLGSYLAFDVTYPVPDIVDPPCMEKGAITFGCLAPLYKITPQAIEAWSEILRGAPGSSLVLRGTALESEGARRYLSDAFASHAVAAERLRLLGPAPHREFLETYNHIDIALDTFPYNGGTTTTEAIWQGVPVISFHGDRWVARTSASILRAAGLSEFVNRDRNAYLAQAIALANSPETPSRLRRLRCGMRQKLRGSSVCDTQTFARNMEAIYIALLEEKLNLCLPASSKS